MNAVSETTEDLYARSCDSEKQQRDDTQDLIETLSSSNGVEIFSHMPPTVPRDIVES